MSPAPPITDDPVRVEFVGGPLCGMVWWPWTDSVSSVWYEEASHTALDHSQLQPGNLPDLIHQLGEGMVCAHFRGAEHLYMWRSDDRYDHEAYTENP